MAREISRQANRKNRNRHHQSSQPLTTESSESEQDEAADEKPVVTNREERNRIANGYSETDGNSNTAAEAECHSCIKSKNHSKTNPETNSQENSGGERFSKTGGKTEVEPSKSERQVGEKGQNCARKKDSASHSGSGQSGSTGKAGSASGGRRRASEFGWYGNMLHDRFYSAWIQPTTNVPSGAKFRHS